MTTAGTLVDRVINQLLSGVSEERNKLADAVNSTTDSIPFLYSLASTRENALFEIDSEIFFVWQANTTSKVATVQRGYAGTTAASHSANAIIKINPRFPRAETLLALNSELMDLASPMNGLYQIKTVDISYNGSDRMVNLTGVTSINEIYDVRYRYLNDDYPIVRDVRLLRDMPTTDFASGYALAFDTSIRAGTVRVIYKAPFGSFTTEASTTENAGVPSHLEDLLVLGAQIRLMAGREIKRNFIESQGDTRRSEEVPPGATVNSMIGLQRLRRERILSESARLAKQYPTRIRK